MSRSNSHRALEESAALSVRGLHKRFAEAAEPALAGIDLDLHAGEVVAVIGESGCGKTTLLRLVAGLDVPDAGVIRIGAQAVVGAGQWVPPERRGVGMVFQDFALFPHMRVSDNVTFGLRSLPRSQRKARADLVLDLLGVHELHNRYPHQLSGGQQQRVALARALAPQPRLLLLDEPFSNLDTPLKSSLRNEVGRLLRHTNVPTLLVVHDIEDVVALADRVAVMRSGRILQVGSAESLYAHADSEYVARFFGEINLIPAKCADGGVHTPFGFIPSSAAQWSERSSGSPCIITRPEDIAVSRTPEDGSPAVVRRAQRIGLHHHLLVVLEGSDTDGCELTAVADPESTFQTGDRVYLRLRHGAPRILSRST